MPRAALPLLAVLLLPVSGQAQAYGVRSLAFQGVGVSVFQVVPARSDATRGARVSGNLGWLAPRLRVMPSVTVWATELRDQEVNQLRQRVEAACEAAETPCPGLEFGQVQVSDLSLDVDAHYVVRGGLGVRPYLGVGAGLSLVIGGGVLIANTFVEEILDAITPGLNATAGFEVPLLRGLRVHGEVRGVLAGGVNWIGAGAGATLILPTRRAPAAEAPR